MFSKVQSNAKPQSAKKKGVGINKTKETIAY
jgi:hypothetical protein